MEARYNILDDADLKDAAMKSHEDEPFPYESEFG
jgi:hypothetical protein